MHAHDDDPFVDVNTRGLAAVNRHVEDRPANLNLAVGYEDQEPSTHGLLLDLKLQLSVAEVDALDGPVVRLRPVRLRPRGHHGSERFVL